MSPVSDPIGDLLTRMRNAQAARHESCRAPWSRILEQLCGLLRQEGWIADVRVIGDEPKKELEVTFDREKPRLTLQRISKPGRRAYSGAKELPPVLEGFGIAVVSTSQGLMTDKEARKRGVGGEVLCTVS